MRLSALALLVLVCAASSATARSPLLPQPEAVPYPTASWPTGPLAADVDVAAIEEATRLLFENRGHTLHPDTRALLVVRRGRIVWERYAEGFDAFSRFRSWSAAKSLIQGLVARLVMRGRLELDAPVGAREWQAEGDPRGAITLRHLLQMTSGLDNEDRTGDRNGLMVRMLFGDLSHDTAHAAASVALLHEPGTYWAYSTGTTQILSRAVGRAIGGGRAGAIAFVRKELAEPLGMRSLIIEFDESGTLLGGAFAWLTARDWARFGTLYLRDGVWEGRRLLPEGWVEFTRTPTPVENNGVFTAHFWITAEPKAKQSRALRPEIESFQVIGAAGQLVVMVPDRDLVVVRLGENFHTSWSLLGHTLSEIVLAFPELAP